MTSALPSGSPSRSWAARVDRRTCLPIPGPVHGAYPIRDAVEFPANAWWAWLRAWLDSPLRSSARVSRQVLTRMRERTGVWQQRAPAQRHEALAQLRARLASEGFTPELSADALGAVAQALSVHTGWLPHDSQVLGAWWMLEGCLIEMGTGEGKSATVVLAAATAALAGVPVHVLTANDYLAVRDAQSWAPVYEALGLGVASVDADTPPEGRRAAYAQPVVYVTAKEVAFDHLRDRSARQSGGGGEPVLRGLCMAFIDEADSVLIDEACTPLILSQTVDAREAEARHRVAVFLARRLQRNTDFDVPDDGPVRLRPSGSNKLAQSVGSMQGPWRWRRFREEQAVLALTALHQLNRDVHYLVRGDEVHIIDATTGRLAIGRAWSRGLHQMVCIKEQVPLSPETVTLLQTTYQEFFPRYHRLAGLSGTVWEERAELLSIYGLPVRRVPGRWPSGRVDEGVWVAPDVASKWAWAAEHARAQAARGRPVLIGVHSVADSEALSAVLIAQGLKHQVLNARFDQAGGEPERRIVEAAGLPGAVTVATHMAGRGTDIQLPPEVLQRGGLHVINTYLHASARIDRQLSGRCGRQGQPGSHVQLLSWADRPLAPLQSADSVGAWLRAHVARRQGRASPLLRHLLAGLQRWSGLKTWFQRWQLLQNQQGMRRQTAWAGRDDWD